MANEDTPTIEAGSYPLHDANRLSALAVAEALRYDGLIQLLVKKGLISADELLQSIDNSARTRMDKVLALVEMTPAPGPPVSL